MVPDEGNHAVLCRPARLARLRSLLTALVTFLVALVAVAAPVLADDPFRLENELVDRVGALSGREAEVRSAQDALAGDGLQLWVVYVASFSGRDAAAWTDETAGDSDLGVRDVLLAVATEDRAYYLSVDASAPVTDAQVDAITADVERYLREGDWAGAAVAAASGLSAAVGGNVPTAGPIVTPGPGQPQPGEGGAGGFAVVALLLLVATVAVVAIGVWLFRRGAGGGAGEARRPGPAPAPGTLEAEIAALEPKELESRANTELVETDDAIRDSEQELGFAEAQFTAEEVAPFRAALAKAKEELTAAFAIRQRLDDGEKEAPTERRAMLEELVVRCERAQRALDAEKDRFDKLRDIERQAPELLAAMPARLADLERSLEAARADEVALGAYAESNGAPVRGHVVEAEKRLAVARQAITEGSAAAAKGDAVVAGRGARLAENALGQAAGLLEAVANLRRTLDGTHARVAAELDQAEPELARAEGAIAGGAPGGESLAARLEEAKTLVASARAHLAGPAPDVVAALADATKANAIGDELLAGLRSAEEAARRTTTALEGVIRDAQAAITQAADLVATRRSAIGGQARTRLAEAGRRLDAAISLGPSDPAAALTEAQAAIRLANEAYREASRDLGGSGMGGGMGGPPTPGGGGGSDLAGAILGGILGGMLGGGMGRGGGLGGTSWGSPFPGGMPGGILGGGRRGGGSNWGGGGRRGGGSNWGGGGRRGGGGRF